MIFANSLDPDQNDVTFHRARSGSKLTLRKLSADNTILQRVNKKNSGFNIDLTSYSFGIEALLTK